jgi:putative flippase GtrA
VNLQSTLRLGSRYAIAGALNTLTGLATILFAEHVIGLSAYVANACGYAVGIAVGFLVNRNWTFNHSGSRSRAAALYVGAFAACYLLNLGVLWIALNVLRWPSFAAQVAAIGLYSVTFFIACKWLVFKDASPAA